MSWNHDRRTSADIREESRKAKASAEARRCPSCRRSAALKVTRTTDKRLIAMYGYVLVNLKCRWCDYKDEIHESD